VRILHIFDHSIPLHSGYAFRSLAILKEQRKLGYHTEHITSIKHYAGQNAVESFEGFNFYRTQPTWRSKFPILNQLDVIYTLEKAIIEKAGCLNIDIIHAHSPSLNAIAAKRAAKKLQLPFVYEMRASWEDAAVSHGTCKEGSVRYKLGQWLEKKALRSADHVTTICQGLANQIENWGVEKQNITVIPNAVDIEKFTLIEHKNAELMAQYQLADKLVLGFLGSFYRYEGLHILIEALVDISKQHDNCVLLLVGGGDEEQNLKTQVKQLGLEQHVIFTGRVAHENIADYYRLVDIFVYPRESIRLTELVTPLKPLEAMAQRGLVVASDIGGHREMLQHNKTGILFTPDSSSDLAKAICALIADKTLWPAIKAAGRAYVEQERSWDKSVKTIQPVYEKLLAGKTP
jgi:PEP-CTERM/exosortase A-associated glycosyltransferase